METHLSLFPRSPYLHRQLCIHEHGRSRLPYPAFAFLVLYFVALFLSSSSPLPSLRPLVCEKAISRWVPESCSKSIPWSSNSLVSPIPAFPIEIVSFLFWSLNFCDLMGEVELKKQISCSIQLTNKSDDYVAFKVIDLGLPSFSFSFVILHFVKP